MAEHFMKEDGRGAAGEERGTVEGLGGGRGAELFEAGAEGADGGFKILLRGQAVGALRFEGLGAEQIHAVRSASGGENDETSKLMRSDDARAFGRDEVSGLIFDGEDD